MEVRSHNHPREPRTHARATARGRTHGGKAVRQGKGGRMQISTPQWMTMGSLLLVVGLLVGAAGAQTVRLPDAEELQREAEARGLKLNLAQMVTLAREDGAVVTAPVAGLEEIPALAYRRGVTLGVAFYHAPAQRIAPGFYTVRAIAPTSQVGVTQGRLQLLDREGVSVATLPATVQVAARTVPAQPQMPATVITATLQLELNALIWWHCWVCPNGVIVCGPLVFPPLPTPSPF